MSRQIPSSQESAARSHLASRLHPELIRGLAQEILVCVCVSVSVRTMRIIDNNDLGATQCPPGQSQHMLVDVMN